MAAIPKDVLPTVPAFIKGLVLVVLCLVVIGAAIGFMPAAYAAKVKGWLHLA